jgi:murein DD-endopeptidase MepM/ murein hydrolase activator NlpD
MTRKSLIILLILILIGALLAGYSFLGRDLSAPMPAQDNSLVVDNGAPANPAAGGDNIPAQNIPVQNTPTQQVPGQNAPATDNPAPPTNADGSGSTQTKQLTAPLADAAGRVTKKPFGIKVSPTDSPVQPEKFSGFHTGVDFEIKAGEENADVPVVAACDGTAVYRNYVSGYGGVFVQSCKLDGQDVTVLYGHLRLASIGKKVGSAVKAGEQLGVLGKGYSTETDGERKHLHLGIHKGKAVNLKGYVQTQAELGGWLDAQKYL